LPERIEIRVDTKKDWKVAYCEFLECSGFGKTMAEAIQHCAMAMQSQMRARYPKHARVSQ
jgi:predicted RNase H-like HicB family nuclease